MVTWQVEQTYDECVRNQAHWERIQGMGYNESLKVGVRKCAPCFDENKIIKPQFAVSDPAIVYGAGGHVVGTPKELKAKEDREAPGLTKQGKWGAGGLICFAVIFALGYLLMGGRR